MVSYSVILAIHMFSCAANLNISYNIKRNSSGIPYYALFIQTKVLVYSYLVNIYFLRYKGYLKNCSIWDCEVNRHLNIFHNIYIRPFCPQGLPYFVRNIVSMVITPWLHICFTLNIRKFHQKNIARSIDFKWIRSCIIVQCVEAETKSTPLRKRHFQTHLLEGKLFHFDSNFIEVYS